MELDDIEQSESIALRQYEIVRLVFRNLPMRDVKVMASVCKVWREVADRTKLDRERLRPAVFCWRAPLRPSGHYKAYDFGCSPDHNDFKEKLSNYMSNLWIDPEVAMVMSVGEPMDIFSEESEFDEYGTPERLPGFHLDAESVDACLPKHCTSTSLALGGVVLTMESKEVVEVENIGSPPDVDVGVAIAFLPRCPSLKLIPFLVSESRSVLMNDIDDVRESRPELTNQEIHEELLQKTCGYRLSTEDKIRCLLAFTNNHVYPYVTRLIKTVCQMTNRQVAVGGAVGNLARCSTESVSLIQNLEEFREHDLGASDNYLKTVGLIIAGEGIETASLVLGKTVKSEAKVRAELQKLKNCNLSEDRAIAFMFSCCARGKYFHKKPDVESSVFRSLFPTVPLVGAFCGGEIGVSCLRNQPLTEDEQLAVAGGLESSAVAEKKAKLQKAPLRDKDVNHSFTTVFVLLSYSI